MPPPPVLRHHQTFCYTSNLGIPASSIIAERHHPFAGSGSQSATSTRTGATKTARLETLLLPFPTQWAWFGTPSRSWSGRRSESRNLRRREGKRTKCRPYLARSHLRHLRLCPFSAGPGRRSNLSISSPANYNLNVRVPVISASRPVYLWADLMTIFSSVMARIFLALWAHAVVGNSTSIDAHFARRTSRRHRSKPHSQMILREQYRCTMNELSQFVEEEDRRL